MARSFARELLPRGIRVNAVSPGPIETQIIDKAAPKDVADEVKRQLRENNPMKRFGRPDEVLGAAKLGQIGLILIQIRPQFGDENPIVETTQISACNCKMQRMAPSRGLSRR
jgi:hypothetical protein